MKKLLFVFAILAASVGAFGQKPGQNLPGKGGSGGTGGGGPVFIVFDSTSINQDQNGAYKVADLPGLIPGTYTNPIVRVRSDGRIDSVRNGTSGGSDQWGRYEPGFVQLIASPHLPRVVLSTTAGTLNVTSGTGAANNNSGSADGFPRYSTATSTGTTTTGYAGVAVGSMSGTGDYLIGSANYTQMTEMKVSALPDATEDYEVYSGFTSSYGFPTAPSSFVGVRIRWNGTAVEYHFVTRSSNTETTTPIVVTATNYFKFKYVIPADRSKVDFYLNGSSTPTATHTANIPANGTVMFFWHGIGKKAGTTSRAIYTRFYWPYMSGYTF